MRLEHLFRAAVLGISTAHCDEDAQFVPTPDASSSADASDDVSDATFQFVPDVAVYVCDAGPPTFVDACGGCCATMQQHCAIPESEIANDAGSLWSCEAFCPDSGVWGCSVEPSDGDPLVRCQCNGRRFEGYEDVGGEGFANMARLEAASVFAFERLHDELGDLGAPPRLLSRVRRAAQDERRHTRMMTRLASRFGGRVARVRVPRFRPRGVEAIALENASEGCVRELFGAAVATWHAARARDADIRRTFGVIAHDETQHAELALRVNAFLSRRLDANARRRVAAARREMVKTLRREIGSDARSLALFDAVFRTMRG